MCQKTNEKKKQKLDFHRQPTNHNEWKRIASIAARSLCHSLLRISKWRDKNRRMHKYLCEIFFHPEWKRKRSHAKKKTEKEKQKQRQNELCMSLLRSVSPFRKKKNVLLPMLNIIRWIRVASTLKYGDRIAAINTVGDAGCRHQFQQFIVSVIQHTRPFGISSTPFSLSSRILI